MKYLFMILILALLIAGCAKQPPKVVTPAPVQHITLATIYNYGAVHTYTYRITQNIGNESVYNDVTFTVSTDRFNDADVWILSSNTTTETGILQTKMWVDKSTNKCLVTQTQMVNGEAITPQPSSCETIGPYASTDVSDLDSLGKESVQTNLGNFDADKYDYKEISYWVTPKIPVPLKVLYGDGSEKMILMSYS